jgi:hypothetical protein
MPARAHRLVLAVIVAIAGGCAPLPAAAPSSTVAPSSAPPSAAPASAGGSSAEAASAAPSAGFGARIVGDLGVIDNAVRSQHPAPFANNPETAWTTKLARLRASLPSAGPDEALVQVQSLVALLDTHSALFVAPGDSFPIVTHRFAEGFFITAANDSTLVGSRIDAIDGTAIATVEAKLRPLIAADNESGKLDALGVSGVDPEADRRMGSPNVLHGLGIIADPARATFSLTRPDGSHADTVLDAVPGGPLNDALQVTGGLNGPAPRAVARRNEVVWTLVDRPHKAFIFSVNDMHDDEIPAALDAMTAALAAKIVNRVILDLRYARGGSSGAMAGLVAALAGDARINRAGGLLVLIGREDISASTTVIAQIDAQTNAIFFGEATPARADNFLDPVLIDLPASGWQLEIPTFTFHTGDPRSAIEPDVPIPPTAADFFAGRDRTLEAALTYRG